MKNKLVLMSILIFLLSTEYVKSQSEVVNIQGNSLLGTNVNGESIREVIGNVVLTQGKVKITCNKATQYLSRNQVVLEGNVIVYQDNVRINAPRALYYGLTKTAECRNGVKLYDGEMVLTANNGSYYAKESKAYFYDNVKLTNKGRVLTCNTLFYYSREKKAISKDNVKLVDSTYIISAADLIYYKEIHNALATNQVEVINIREKSKIYCNYLEHIDNEKLTIFRDNPIFLSVDTSAKNIDTTLIRANIFEIHKNNKNSNIILLKDSVEFIKNELKSVNSDTRIYGSDTIRIFRKGEQKQPIVWFSGSQLLSDTINIYRQNGQLSRSELLTSASIFTQNKLFHDRYDQVSSDNIYIYFNTQSKLKMIDLKGNLLAIYYSYEDHDSTANGLVKASSLNGKIYFDSSKVSDIKLYGAPISDYYPENKLKGNEKDFVLPTFRIESSIPDKQKLLKLLSKSYPKYFK